MPAHGINQYIIDSEVLRGVLVLFLPTAIFIEFLNSRLNPLPKEIQTFGDLARYLAIITEDRQPQGA